MTVVVILTVRQDALDAAAVMATHGGRIERTVVAAADAPDHVRELHVVTFPDEPAFRAYRADPRLAAAAHLRARSVVHTELLVGEDGPGYDADVTARELD
jgi:hypothetical protein